MRLLEVLQDGTLRLTKDLTGSNGALPAYAILSHTWVEDEEVTFDDLEHETGDHKAGYRKIRFCAQQAQRDGLRYFWVDTCCINKADAAELQTAINSMFSWYRDAARCYVFLSDVQGPAEDTTTMPGALACESEFRKSRWFTRGWTLQELLAPRRVTFFSQDWKLLGDRKELKEPINEITGIPVPALSNSALENFSVEERLSWSNGRRTTRREDRAYSLFGLFSIFMPLIYGEGEENAFRRLKREIMEASREDSQKLLPVAPTASSVPTPVAANKACYVLPFMKNRYFVGRRDELEMLKQKLLIDRDCDRMSIVGLGGTGKTQLALQFAYMVKETMSGVSIFWVPALSMASFEQACASIVSALEPGQAGKNGDDAKVHVRDYLSSEQAGRWLFVLDNADDPDLMFGGGHDAGILDYLPESEKGVTLFTTRVQDVAVSLSRGDVLELGPMSKRDATAFLEKSLVKKSLVQDAVVSRQLLDELAYLPLAISQAAAYLNRNKISIKKYIELLKSTEQSEISVMSKEFRDVTRYKESANAVAKTWVVSFSQIRERDEAAADLLSFITLIEWRAIPRSLLEGLQSEEQTEEAIGTLCGYSFLVRRENDEQKEDGKEEYYDMHRLVHLAARNWMSQQTDNESTTNHALRHVTEIFPKDYHENRLIWRAYMPHVFRMLEVAQSSDEWTKSELRLLVGRCLLFERRNDEAVAWLEESCQWRVEKFKEDNPDRLLVENDLARAYRSAGRTKEAIALLEHVTKVDEKLLKEDEAARLMSQHNLAKSYRSDGQIEKAMALLEHVVSVREKGLAEDHPSRLISQHELAIVYREDGQLLPAMKLLEHCVEVQKRALPEDHPALVSSQHELAITYRDLGLPQQAVTLLEHVVALRERTHAEDHPYRLASQSWLAIFYQKDGRYKDAIALLEKVAAVDTVILAEDHPHRISTQHRLAIAYQSDGRVQEAVTLLEHIIEVKQRVCQAEDRALARYMRSLNNAKAALAADGRSPNSPTSGLSSTEW